MNSYTWGPCILKEQPCDGLQSCWDLKLSVNIGWGTFWKEVFLATGDFWWICVPKRATTSFSPLSLFPALHMTCLLCLLVFRMYIWLQICQYQEMMGWLWDRALDGHRRGSWWVTDMGSLSDTEGHMIFMWWICDSPHGTPPPRHSSPSRSGMQVRVVITKFQEIEGPSDWTGCWADGEVSKVRKEL
jgi:hypothetical protein